MDGLFPRGVHTVLILSIGRVLWIVAGSRPDLFSFKILELLGAKGQDYLVVAMYTRKY